jgi:hypothetical protein
MPRLRHLPSQQLAACATAEDEHFIAFRLGQFQLPRDGCSAASGAANANARRSKPILSGSKNGRDSLTAALFRPGYPDKCGQTIVP